LTLISLGRSLPKSKRSQVTMFVIIAIVIIVIGVLIYMFYPKIKSTLGLDTQNPYQFIQSCLEDDVKDAVEILSLQGGSIQAKHYIVYNGDNIEYLCYTGEYYQTCVMQQPMLKSHIEGEIEQQINAKARTCFDNMKESFEKRGFEVNLRKVGMEVELLPKRVIVSFNHSLTLTKNEPETFDTFRVVLNNNLYELVSITNSILNWEARYGDAETTLYMNYYRDLKVEKKKQVEGSTIYILTNRNNQNKFQFASRSVAWPPGYT